MIGFEHLIKPLFSSHVLHIIRPLLLFFYFDDRFFSAGFLSSVGRVFPPLLFGVLLSSLPSLVIQRSLSMNQSSETFFCFYSTRFIDFVYILCNSLAKINGTLSRQPKKKKTNNTRQTTSKRYINIMCFASCHSLNRHCRTLHCRTCLHCVLRRKNMHAFAEKHKMLSGMLPKQNSQTGMDSSL